MKVNQPDGTVQDEFVLTGSRSEDKGQVVEGLNMAAGATVYGSWIDNVNWVRNVVFFAQSDQQYDVVMQRRDIAQSITGDKTLAATQAAFAAPGFRTDAISGASAVLGYSSRFGIKNSAAVVNTYARLRVQLLGL